MKVVSVYIVVIQFLDFIMFKNTDFQTLSVLISVDRVVFFVLFVYRVDVVRGVWYLYIDKVDVFFQFDGRESELFILNQCLSIKYFF